MRSFILLLLLCARVWAATGDIVSATILTNGWAADIRISGLNTNGTYAMGLGVNNDPALGNPKITFTVVSLGYDDTGTATTITRTVYGTRQVRMIYPNPTLNQESTTGSDVIVRVALSDYIFAKDNTGGGNSGTAPVVTILSGFYTAGSANNTSIALAVSNGSTVAYPKTIANWSWPGFDKVGAAMTLRCVAFHRSGQQGRPVRCVKFSAADTHSHTASAFVLTPRYDSTIPDAVPVVEYFTSLTTSGFTQNDIVTANFIAYPWVGDSGALLDTSAGTAQVTPLVGPLLFVADPNGTYATTAVVIDPVSGVDATGVVTTNFVAGSPPSAFLTMAAGFNAMRGTNNSLYSRNNCGGSTIYLKDGTNAWVNGTPTLGTAPDTYLTITKFPTSTRSACIIGNQLTNRALGLKVKLDSCLYTGQNASGNVSSGAATESVVWVNNCEINCPVSGQPAFYQNKVWHLTDNLITSLDTGIRPFATTFESPSVVRGNTVNSVVALYYAYTALGNQINSMSSVGGFTDIIAGGATPAMDNNILAYNKMNISMTGAPAAVFGQTTTHAVGMAMVQNLIENKAVIAGPMLQIAADNTFASTDPYDNVIIWNNTFIGQRLNASYNETGSAPFSRKLWSIKNNVVDDYNIKADTFGGNSVTSLTRSGTTATLTYSTGHGYTTGDTIHVSGANLSQYNGDFVCTVTSSTVLTYVMSSDPGGSASGAIIGPHGGRTGNWANVFGVGYSGNQEGEITGVGAGGLFLGNFAGLKSWPPTVSGEPPVVTANPTNYFKFLAPASYNGAAAGAGNGNYRLGPTSPALRMARDYLIPVDMDGRGRQSGDAAGVYSGRGWRGGGF